MTRPIVLWIVVGLAGFLILPWYSTDAGFWTFGWIADGYPLDRDVAPALFQVLVHQRWWLAPIVVIIALTPLALFYPHHDRRYARTLIAVSAAGLGYLLLQGFAIGIGGWRYETLEALFGPVEAQYGMGYGAVLVAGAFLFLVTSGIAARGYASGDRFVVGSIGLIVALIALFVFFPVTNILSSAALDNDGNVALAEFAAKITDRKNLGS